MNVTVLFADVSMADTFLGTGNLQLLHLQDAAAACAVIQVFVARQQVNL